MQLKERIEAFAALGKVLGDALDGKGDESESLRKVIERQQVLNPWFTPRNVEMAISAIVQNLDHQKLTRWTSSYSGFDEAAEPGTTAVIMAGNIPLVGFHDFLSVLVSGNRVIIKASSKDNDLIKYISGLTGRVSPVLGDRIRITDENLHGFDSVIATGSDNSSRYFNYYFGKYPNIIRKNRNSIAVINGNEKNSDLEALGRDVFTYFGLGCRNVSKIYIPRGMNIGDITRHWSDYSDIINHQKYANNYDYNMAVWMVNKVRYHDTGYLLVKEDTGISSPVATLFFEYYDTETYLENRIRELNDRIQCIAGLNHLPFGTTQSPELWDYADNADTLDFLLKKKLPGIS